MSNASYNEFHTSFGKIVDNYKDNANSLWLACKKAANMYLEDGESRAVKDIEDALATARKEDTRDLKAALSGAINTFRAIAWGEFHHAKKSGQDCWHLPFAHSKETLKAALDEIGLDAWKEGRDGFKAVFQLSVVVKKDQKTPEQRLEELAAAAGKILMSMDKEALDKFIAAVKKEAGVREEAKAASDAAAKFAAARKNAKAA